MKMPIARVLYSMANRAPTSRGKLLLCTQLVYCTSIHSYYCVHTCSSMIQFCYVTRLYSRNQTARVVMHITFSFPSPGKVVASQEGWERRRELVKARTQRGTRVLFPGVKIYGAHVLLISSMRLSTTQIFNSLDFFCSDTVIISVIGSLLERLKAGL
jgi:hypothetical protein